MSKKIMMAVVGLKMSFCLFVFLSFPTHARIINNK